MLALLLAFMVSVNPFAEVKRAEAIVPVAAGAGAALAAELGISVEGLYLGTAALIAGATGYCVTSDSFNNMTADLKTQWDRLFEPGADLGDMTDDRNFWDGYSNGDLSPAGSKRWDELNADEKSKYGTPAAYTLGCWDGLEMELGLLQENGNGGLEPTPTPEGGGPLQKLKNVLTVLGVTGAAVAVQDGVNALAENLGTGIHNLLFGDGTGKGLGASYQVLYTIDDCPVQFVNADFSIDAAWGHGYGGTDCFQIGPMNNYGNCYYCVHNHSYVDIYFALQNPGTSSAFWSSTGGYVSARCFPMALNNYWNVSTIPTTQNGVLNVNWGGTYHFGETAVWSNGVMTGEYEGGAGYGQMTQTPPQIIENIFNDNGLQQFFQNYQTDGLPEGQQRAIAVPLTLGDTATNPDYENYVQPRAATEVFPTPSDQPVTPPQIGPVVTPPSTPDGYTDDFAAMTNKLLQGPFDQLFPFCLIADFRDFVFIILSGGTVQTTRLKPNQLYTQSDTPVDQLNGVHTLTLDFSGAMEDFVTTVPLDPLHELLGYTRFTLTCVLIMFIVYQSFGFFLKRGA